MELLLSLKDVPDGLWKEFKSSVQVKLRIIILRKKCGFILKNCKARTKS